ncbi:MAG: stage II sporulation protein D [Oscillibacter sp.]|nr:stage II sporulation protein D [Oscillibacter sp.]
MNNNHLQNSIAVSVLLMTALFTLPLAAIAPFRPAPEPPEAPITTPAQDPNEAPPPAPFVSGTLDKDIPLRVLDNGAVREMDLGTYLVGVVRAEMPASFPLEALKAQATAARTYTLYKLISGGSHGDTAHICTDSTCCQAYIDEDRARANWGEDANAYEEKIRQAVLQTDGQAILYNGAPILAVFHSSSAGLTRAAGQVWQNDLPYLQAVESPEPNDRIPNYYSRADFTPADFRTRFLASHPEANLSGSPTQWLTNPTTDSAGSVLTVTVGGVTIRGTQLRTILGLRSACFTWEATEKTISFYVTGYGHGVGMSQYGAKQMADSGADFREILTHYYTGVTVGAVPAYGGPPAAYFS